MVLTALEWELANYSLQGNYGLYLPSMTHKLNMFFTFFVIGEKIKRMIIFYDKGKLYEIYIFIYKDLLEHSHINLFMHSLWLLSLYNKSWVAVTYIMAFKKFTSWSFIENVC